MLHKLETQDPEDRILESQYDVVKAQYGEEIANIANYGWGIDENSVSTKVYRPEGHMVLTSHIDATDAVAHDWSEY